MAYKTPDCYTCKHKRNVPGNAHIECKNPDPNMKGDSYGISQGWFMYPFLFDPTWMNCKCANYELDVELAKKVLTDD